MPGLGLVSVSQNVVSSNSGSSLSKEKVFLSLLESPSNNHWMIGENGFWALLPVKQAGWSLRLMKKETELWNFVGAAL